jgi:hypothetical protein
MAKVNLTPEEYGDFVAIFLLDAMTNEDVLADNEEFRELMDNLKGKGARPILIQYFLSLPSIQRTDYKRIKTTMLRDKGQDQSDIIIRRDRAKEKKEAEKKKKPGLIRKAIKAVTGQ